MILKQNFYSNKWGFKTAIKVCFVQVNVNSNIKVVKW